MRGRGDCKKKHPPPNHLASHCAASPQMGIFVENAHNVLKHEKASGGLEFVRLCLTNSALRTPRPLKRLAKLFPFAPRSLSAFLLTLFPPFAKSPLTNPPVSAIINKLSNQRQQALF